MAIKQKETQHHISPADLTRVMEVAGRLFAQNGFEGTGIRLIAKESGVTMPSIFYHFGSKASLYEEVLEYKYKSVTEMVLTSIDALHDPKEKVECIIGTFFDLLLRDQTFLLLVHRDIVDVVAHKHRPAFMEEYAYVFSLFWKLLNAAFGREIERRVVFALVSLIMGFCDLTAIMSETGESAMDRQVWFGQQRAELIELGKRLCIM